MWVKSQFYRYMEIKFIEINQGMSITSDSSHKNSPKEWGFSSIFTLPSSYTKFYENFSSNNCRFGPKLVGCVSEFCVW